MKRIRAKRHTLAGSLKRNLKTWQLVMKDPRTPLIAKILLALAIGYFMLPFDLIPDFIPVVGQLDDLIIIPLLIVLALKFIPQNVINDCKKRSQAL